MSELTYFVLKFGFLALMWVFVFIVVYALRSDLFGQPLRKLVAAAQQRSAPAAPPAGAAHATGATAQTAAIAADGDPATRNRDSREARRLVIIAGPKEGLEIDLPDEQLTIGRSNDAGLVIRDDYTSSHHARLLKWPNGWVIQDLDSTNGTFLDGARVHSPTYVPLNTSITIGTTTFELRR